MAWNWLSTSSHCLVCWEQPEGASGSTAGQRWEPQPLGCAGIVWGITQGKLTLQLTRFYVLGNEWGLDVGWFLSPSIVQWLGGITVLDSVCKPERLESLWWSIISEFWIFSRVVFPVFSCCFYIFSIKIGTKLICLEVEVVPCSIRIKKHKFIYLVGEACFVLGM